MRERIGLGGIRLAGVFGGCFGLSSESPFDGCCDESSKQRVGFGRLTLELGVELDGQEEGVGGEFEDFDQASVGAQSGESHSVGFVLFSVEVVEFVAMPMALADRIGLVGITGDRIGDQLAGLGT